MLFTCWITRFSYNIIMKEELITTDKLLEIITNQAKENSSQKEEINTLISQNNYLQEKIDYLVRQQFASKSEKFNLNQLSLFEDNEEKIEVEADEEIEIEFKRKKGGRSSPSKDLPRVRVEHDISEEEKLCSCGDKMHRIKEVIFEQYDIVPARFQIIKNVRFVYGCRCGAAPVTTPVTLHPSTNPGHSFIFSNHSCTEV